MKASHEKMKKDLQTKHGVPSGQCNHAHGFDDDDSDDDLVSIRSSIDLDEEPMVHVATAMTFTRITPGMVKLVDIPPRRKKPDVPFTVSDVPALPVAPAAISFKIMALSGGIKPPSKPAYAFEHDESISPFNERSQSVEVRKSHTFSRMPG
jgi:hypothetical protein